MSNPMLTEREIQVMWLVAEGLSNKLIADRLGISDHTAKFHVGNAVKKLKTTSRTRAAVNFIILTSTTSQQWLEWRANSAAPIALPEPPLQLVGEVAA